MIRTVSVGVDLDFISACMVKQKRDYGRCRDCNVEGGSKKHLKMRSAKGIWLPLARKNELL
jgi:hypothetical protein